MPAAMDATVGASDAPAVAVDATTAPAGASDALPAAVDAATAPAGASDALPAAVDAATAPAGASAAHAAAVDATASASDAPAAAVDATTAPAGASDAPPAAVDAATAPAGASAAPSAAVPTISALLETIASKSVPPTRAELMSVVQMLPKEQTLVDDFMLWASRSSLLDPPSVLSFDCLDWHGKMLNFSRHHLPALDYLSRVGVLEQSDWDHIQDLFRMVSILPGLHNLLLSV